MRRFAGSLMILHLFGCGPSATPSARVVLTCDLAETRHLRNVRPEKAAVGGLRSYEGPLTLRLRIDNGWTFDQDVYHVLISEDNDHVRRVYAKTDGLSLEAAEQLGMSLCQDWGLDPRELRTWVARIQADPLYPSLYEKSTRGMPPFFTLGFAHSGLREAPWSLYFQILWE